MIERIDKLDFIKTENYCSVNDTVKRMNRQTTGCKKIFAKHISDKGLLPKIHKEFLKLSNKKANKPILK